MNKNNIYLKGYLSPDGIFYKCTNNSYNEVSKKLVKELKIDSKSDNENILINNNWIAVRFNSAYSKDCLKISEKQREFIENNILKFRLSVKYDLLNLIINNHECDKEASYGR